MKPKKRSRTDKTKSIPKEQPKTLAGVESKSPNKGEISLQLVDSLIGGSALDTVMDQKEAREAFREAHKYIQDHIVTGRAPDAELNITNQVAVSKVALGDYVTLDWQHYQEINELKRVIRAYAKDPTRRRPLNIILQAEPGSGKSHFIKSLAKGLASDGLTEVTFNMSSLGSADDFIPPLEDVRNIKVGDKIPLLFLDEFDSNHTNYPLLLPLLWDGQFYVGQRRLRIGKVVIILAGSGKEISEVMKNSKGMKKDIAIQGKLPDLLSRINGGELTIPELDDFTSNRDRRVDKVCLTTSLLTKRFPSLAVAPWAFLRFVAETRFRYGVRSISHLIDSIPALSEQETVLESKALQLPLNNVASLKASSLAYHFIAEDGPAAVIENWKNLEAHLVGVRFRYGRSSFNTLFQELFGGTRA